MALLSFAVLLPLIRIERNYGRKMAYTEAASLILDEFGFELELG
jgi:hypothetical protein